MWRSAVVERAAALRRRAVSCARAASVPTHAASGVPFPPHRPDFYVRHGRLSNLTALLLRPPFLSRGYARMRRRIPPVQLEEESESEYESEPDEFDLAAEETGEADDGNESKEWEGIMLEFGTDGEDEDEDEDKDDEEAP